MLPSKWNKLGITPLGDVSAFRVQITPADISGSTAQHTFFVVASAGCKVYWGDGASSTLATGTNTCTHSYANTGQYLVQIRGAHTRYYHGTGSTAGKVIEAVKLYTGLTSTKSAFTQCNNAKFKVNSGFRIGSNVTDCSDMFNFCNGSAFTLPSGFTIPNSVANCYQMFNGCNGASFTLPVGFALPSGALWNTNSMFASCYGASFALPAGFTIPNSVTNCAYMFYNCNGSAFNLPSTFRLGSSVKTCAYMFQRCFGNAFNLPAGFIIPNSVTDCSGMFKQCFGNAFVLPSGFVLSSNVTSIGEMFYQCTGNAFTSLPASFVIPASCRNMEFMFAYCSKLTADISNIFPTWATGISMAIGAAFIGTKITGTAPADKLWNRTDITWFQYTTAAPFLGVTTLSNYASIPVGWK